MGKTRITNMGVCRSKSVLGQEESQQSDGIVAEANPLGQPLLELHIRIDTMSGGHFRVTRFPDTTLHSLLDHLRPQIAAMVAASIGVSGNEPQWLLDRALELIGAGEQLRVVFSHEELPDHFTLEGAGMSTEAELEITGVHELEVQLAQEVQERKVREEQAEEERKAREMERDRRERARQAEIQEEKEARRRWKIQVEEERLRTNEQYLKARREDRLRAWRHLLTDRLHVTLEDEVQQAKAKAQAEESETQAALTHDQAVQGLIEGAESIAQCSTSTSPRTRTLIQDLIISELA